MQDPLFGKMVKLIQFLCTVYSEKPRLRKFVIIAIVILSIIAALIYLT